jgi:hypothetical protein
MGFVSKWSLAPPARQSFRRAGLNYEKRFEGKENASRSESRRLVTRKGKFLAANNGQSTEKTQTGEGLKRSNEMARSQPRSENRGDKGSVYSSCFRIYFLLPYLVAK